MLKAFVGSPGDLSFKDGLVLKHLSKHWLVLKIKWGGVAANSAKDFLWNSSADYKGILPLINYFSCTEFFLICAQSKISLW